MILFAFDRDSTVDSSPDPGPIPLAWIKWLVEKTEHEVWAVGNQALKAEAGIPGIDEMRDRLDIAPKAAKGLVGVDHAAADVSKRQRNVNSKIKRLGFLSQLFPDAARKIVTDDFDLSQAEGWEYYSPADFVRLIMPQFGDPA